MRYTARWLGSASLLALVLISGTNRAAAQFTSTDVCAALDRVNRALTVVMEEKRIHPPTVPQSWEQGLDVMHVYQLQVACLDRLFEAEGDDAIGRIPLMASRPTQYTASDIVAVSEVMREEIRRLAWKMGIPELPEEKPKWREKSIDDAFGEALEMHYHLNALTGKDQIHTDDIYPQLVRATADAKAILQHLDKAHRYRIDAPTADRPSSRQDALEACFQVRRTINAARGDLGMQPTPVPENQPGQIRAEDAFVQTQLILAELNLLKLRTGVTAGSSSAVPVSDKTHQDVYNQALLLNYLIEQIPTARRLGSQTAGR